MSKKNANSLNVRTKHPDFFGWPGALAITVSLPVLFNVMAYTCTSAGCPAWGSWHLYKAMLDPKSPDYRPWISREAAYAYATWIAVLVGLDVVLPGKQVEGTLLRDGRTRLGYKFNGTLVMSLLFTVLGARFLATGGAMPELVFVHDHLIELLNVAILTSFLFSTLLYIAPTFYSEEPLFALGGNTGNAFFDWFIGRELNPRIGALDLKVFCEMRPGMLLWVVINLAMAHHQYVTYGYVTDAMALTVVFQNWYVIEGTFYESGLVSMMDITSDGFGFMLVFGDLVVVPFSYTFQARFLAASAPYSLGLSKCLALIVLYIAGYVIFRQSNTQKSLFKASDPSTSHLRYLTSSNGSRLITSGWWGFLRHVNYFGDLLMSLAYTLPCGFASPIPWYFPLYFAVLLIHRNARDEEKCRAKYGEAWEEYKRQVPYALIPYIY